MGFYALVSNVFVSSSCVGRSIGLRVSASSQIEARQSNCYNLLLDHTQHYQKLPKQCIQPHLPQVSTTEAVSKSNQWTHCSTPEKPQRFVDTTAAADLRWRNSKENHSKATQIPRSELASSYYSKETKKFDRPEWALSEKTWYFDPYCVSDSLSKIWPVWVEHHNIHHGQNRLKIIRPSHTEQTIRTHPIRTHHHFWNRAYPILTNWFAVLSCFTLADILKSIFSILHQSDISSRW